MFTCRACLHRCIQALETPTGPRGHAVESLFQSTRLRQFHASTRDAAARDQSSAQDDGANKTSNLDSDNWAESAAARNRNAFQRIALRKRSIWNATPTPNLEGLGRDRTMSQSDFNKRKQELRHLQDPLELANFVKDQLAKGRDWQMLQLVRMASHSMPCVVSFNHIIDHLLASERIRDAMSVYNNDMKKRGHFPDAYTYTILLRGLSSNAHHSGSLGKALSIYHSMSAPNSRVEPSIIHTNAVLRVCARAMDMDALWGIAGKIPDSGPGAANAITYITIINALRQNLLLAAPRDETAKESADRKERVIVEGRRLWEEIVARWRNADLKIDEELVCAMGRLLLVGSRPRDWDDVFSLVEQTMDIPRFIPRLGTLERSQADAPRLRMPNVHPDYRYDDDHLGPGDLPMRGDEFLALTPQGVGSAVSNPLVYVRPGNNTLSMVQEACQKNVSVFASDKYWNLLTDPGTYNVTPDLNNVQMRLRVLRQNRASTKAVELLEEMVLSKGLEVVPGTFRIASSACIRDKNNHNSLKNAGKVLQIMLEKCENMDIKTVGTYADLATKYPLAKSADLVDALTILNPIVNNIRQQLSVGRGFHTRKPGAVYLTGENRKDAIHVLKKVYGLYDRLLFSDLLQQEQKAPFKQERARLSSYLNRVLHKEEKRGENLLVSGGAKGENIEEANQHEYLQKEDVEPKPHSGERERRGKNLHL